MQMCVHMLEESILRNIKMDILDEKLFHVILSKNLSTTSHVKKQKKGDRNESYAPFSSNAIHFFFFRFLLECNNRLL